MTRLQAYLNDYNIKISSCQTMEGYETEIHKITSEQGKNYTLKIYPYSQDNWADLQAENKILNALQGKLSYDIPYPISSNNKEQLIKIDNKIARLLHYVQGEFWGNHKGDNTFHIDLGTQMANMDIELEKLETHDIKARQLNWDLNNLMNNFELLKYVSDPVDKKLILYFFDQYENLVQPKINKLPQTIIHNDFNPWNVLVENNKITGLIDFGDMVYSSRINELAVALSYLLCESENILLDTEKVLGGYHAINPLLTDELDLLYYLIAGRIITSLVNSAQGKLENPTNEYISISEKSYRALLRKWITISPIAFKNNAYQACKFSTPDKSGFKKGIAERRKEYFTSGLSLSYSEPIYMSAAAFQYMYDEDGNTYLDAYNNIPIVGHSHPSISRKISRQVRTLNTNTRYHYEQLTNYASNLLKHFPKSLNKLFFVNSGSAASDLAIRLASTHTRRKDLFVLEDGYHGNTQIGIDISPYKHDNKGGPGKAEHIHHFPLPKEFNNTRSSQQMTFDAIARIDDLSKQGINPAAFIAEPISGCGGQVPLPENYLASIFPKIKAEGGLCIVDEVQVGFGRLGSWFWGFEMLKVIPDIVILGKPIGNGHPMAAVVCSESVADSFNNGMEFFSSFGGNPVSCLIGNEVLNILDRENLQDHAREVGAYWKMELYKLKERHPQLADIRGEGLFLGIEIIIDNQPATQLAADIKNKMKEAFILTSTDGKHNNVIKMKPPLCFNKENVDHFCSTLDLVLSNLNS